MLRGESGALYPTWRDGALSLALYLAWGERGAISHVWEAERCMQLGRRGALYFT